MCQQKCFIAAPKWYKSIRAEPGELSPHSQTPVWELRRFPCWDWASREVCLLCQCQWNHSLQMSVCLVCFREFAKLKNSVEKSCTIKIVVNIPLCDFMWFKQVLHLVRYSFIAATNSCSVYFKERVEITVCPFLRGKKCVWLACFHVSFDKYRNVTFFWKSNVLYSCPKSVGPVALTEDRNPSRTELVSSIWNFKSELDFRFRFLDLD